MYNTEFIEVQPGLLLHTIDWGEGIPVVFIHGWPLSNEMWEYQLNLLPRRGCRCVAPSLRGFGKSDQPWGDDNYTYDVMADDVKKIMDKLDLRDVVLVGFSMGGAVALHYMARHKGERVAKLVLAGAATPRFTKGPDYPLGMEKEEVNNLIEESENDRSLMNADFAKLFFHSYEAASPELADWFHGLCMQASPHATTACLATLRDGDLHDDLASVQIPTLILHGAMDQICPIGLGKVTANGIKDSKLVRFEASGHGLFYEEKDKFNNELLEFIGVKEQRLAA